MYTPSQWLHHVAVNAHSVHTVLKSGRPTRQVPIRSLTLDTDVLGRHAAPLWFALAADSLLEGAHELLPSRRELLEGLRYSPKRKSRLADAHLTRATAEEQHALRQRDVARALQTHVVGQPVRHAAVFRVVGPIHLNHDGSKEPHVGGPHDLLLGALDV